MTNGNYVANGQALGFDCLQNWVAVHEQKYGVLSRRRAIFTEHSHLLLQEALDGNNDLPHSSFGPHDGGRQPPAILQVNPCYQLLCGAGVMLIASTG